VEVGLFLAAVCGWKRQLRAGSLAAAVHAQIDKAAQNSRKTARWIQRGVFKTWLAAPATEGEAWERARCASEGRDGEEPANLEGELGRPARCDIASGRR
jgi:hypothetical protein